MKCQLVGNIREINGKFKRERINKGKVENERTISWIQESRISQES